MKNEHTYCYLKAVFSESLFIKILNYLVSETDSPIPIYTPLTGCRVLNGRGARQTFWVSPLEFEKFC